jgi:hypothetical protein
MASRLILIDKHHVAVFIPWDLPKSRTDAVRRVLARSSFTRECRRLVNQALRGVSSAVNVRISR